jgi:hypothetical protein
VRSLGGERLAPETNDPTVKIAPTRLPAKSGRQMNGLPPDRTVIIRAVRLAPADQGKLGERRGKQVAAKAIEPTAIFEDEEVIDKRAMTLHWR